MIREILKRLLSLVGCWFMSVVCVVLAVLIGEHQSSTAFEISFLLYVAALAFFGYGIYGVFRVSDGK